MIRILVFFALLAAFAFGLGWLIDRPGDIVLNWQGYRVEAKVLVAGGVLLAIVAALIAAWNLLLFLFRLPQHLSGGREARRREKGYSALSRGIVAVGTGDGRQAVRAAAEAQRLLPEEPLALLLKAEAAQLTGDHRAVEAAFRAMTRGDVESAHHFATAAHGIAALPWTAAEVLKKHVLAKDWEGALDVLETSGSLIDKKTRERQRAVLMTAIGLEKENTEPDQALRLARQAIKRAPDLVPAVALAARLFARKGANRKAAKIIETDWPLAPHPDLAKDYLDLRPGESNSDRLARARALAKLAPSDPESAMTVAGAAIAACEYVAAREAMQPLLQGSEPPTARMCLLMAELEEAEHGDGGYAREWLARASRAPRDACWIADGLISEQWLPASPVTGKLDAFIWKKPDQPLGGKAQAEEAIFKAVAPPAKPAALLEKDEPAAIPPPAKAGTPQPGSSSPLPAAQPGEGVGGAGEEPRPVSAEAQVRRGEAKDSAPKAAGAH